MSLPYVGQPSPDQFPQQQLMLVPPPSRDIDLMGFKVPAELLPPGQKSTVRSNEKKLPRICQQAPCYWIPVPLHSAARDFRRLAVLGDDHL